MQLSPCPSDQQLYAFNMGDLPVDVLNAVADHLEHCPRCEDKAQRLDTLVDPILAALREPSPPTPGKTRVLDRHGAAPPAPPVGGSRFLPPLPPPSAWPRLRGYEILGPLGQGGMAVVYKARQFSLNRFVALKMVLRGNRASAEDLARFQNEAEAVARLQHPNLVQIYEIGRQEGQLYLSLEYVDGGSLKEYLGGKPQDARAAAGLVAVLARAMHYAHERGVLHRDLKPANVLLAESTLPGGSDDPAAPLTINEAARMAAPPGAVAAGSHTLKTAAGTAAPAGLPPLSAFTPKITDFGLAQQLDSDRQLTQSGLVAGTPAYMSPEQSLGKREQFRPTLDVYSLGVILYELLTGRVPFDAASTVETLLLVQTREPVPPRQLQPGLPRDLETICLKCLEKEPQKRYPSAQALADDLRRFLADEPIQARPASAWERLGKRARRQPLVAGLTVGLVLVAAAGLAGIVGQWRTAVAERHRAETNAQRALTALDQVAQEQGEKEEQRRQAVRARDVAEANLYVSRVAQSQLEWRLNHDVAGARALLEHCQPGPGAPDHRGWEWHYLRGLYQTGLWTAQVHAGGYAQALAFTPDGRRLITGGGGNPYAGSQGRGTELPGEVTVWDVATGRRLESLTGHTDQVLALALSPDGRRLVSAGRDRRLQVWDLTTARAEFALGPPAARANAAAFGPDGARLVTGHEDRTLTLWDVAARRAERVLTGHQFPVACVAVSPDGRLWATGSLRNLDEGELLLWDAATGDVLDRLSREPVRGLAFSPDGRRLVAAGQAVTLWDVAARRPLHALAGHTGPVHGVAFRPDGRQVATAGADRTVRVWDVRLGREDAVLRGHATRLRSVAYHPDGRTLASGDDTSVVKLWDLTRDPEHTSLNTGWYLQYRAQALAFASAGRQVRVVLNNDQERLVDVETGQVRASRSVDLVHRWLTPATLAAFSGDGRRLATVSNADPRAVQLRDVTTGRDERLVGGPDTPEGQRHTAVVTRLALSGDGQRLVTAAARPDGLELTVWDTATGRPCLAGTMPWLGGRSRAGDVALSPDGRLVAFSSVDTPAGPAGAGDRPPPQPRVLVCEVGAGAAGLAAPRHAFSVPTAVLNGLAFSPDGRRLAAADEAARVFLWDLEAGRPLHARPLQGRAFQLAFSPDGRRLAAVNREEVKLWDVASGQEVLTLRGARPPGTDIGFNPQLAWSPDGRRLAASNWDRTVAVWGLDDPADTDLAARWQAAEGRAFRWHLVGAARALSEQESAAFDFHWPRVRDAAPPDGPSRRWRGHLNAILGRWPAAAADYVRSLPAAPADDPRGWCDLAAIQRLAGDEDGCRQTCQALARPLGSAAVDRDDAVRLAGTLALLNTGVVPPEELLARAKGLTGPAEPSWGPWHVLALAQYRAGLLADALTSGRRAQGATSAAHLRAISHLLLALVHHRLGQPEEARQSLARAEDWFRQLAPGEADRCRVLLERHPEQGLTFLVLRQEAPR